MATLAASLRDGERAAKISVGASGRPHPGERVSGDAHAVSWIGRKCRIALVDGLGHGPPAAFAAQSARSELAARPQLDPVEALRACHQALRNTRGAAISIVDVDPISHRLVGAGVGNVDVHVRSRGLQQRIVASRGIVGCTLPVLQTVQLTLGDEWTLVVHTDGVSACFGLDTMPIRLGDNPQSVAEDILRRWARDSDDATVVVATQRREF
jgi:serine phosphatase RsbU (regulator of sigma subunit)